jgi:hypothetical protein
MSLELSGMYSRWMAESNSCQQLAPAGPAAAAAAQGTRKRPVVAEPDYGPAAVFVPLQGIAYVVADLMTTWL